MKKVNPQAKWFGLSPEQIVTLEAWLFEAHLTFDEATKRAKEELGFTGSRSGLHRFYHDRSRQKILEELGQSAAQIREIEDAPGNQRSLLHTGLKLLAEKFLRQVIEQGGADVATVAALLLKSEANEARRQANEIRLQELELRRRKLELDREAWEFEKTERAVKALPKLDRLAITKADAEDPFFDNKRHNLRMRALYGSACTNRLDPENEAEDAAMVAEDNRSEEAWYRSEAALREQPLPRPNLDFYVESAAKPPAPTAPRNQPSPAEPASPNNSAAHPVTKAP